MFEEVNILYFSICKPTAAKQNELTLNADLAVDRSIYHAQEVLSTALAFKAVWFKK